MVKSKEEIAAERAAQKKALREAMKAGRERLKKQQESEAPMRDEVTPAEDKAAEASTPPDEVLQDHPSTMSLPPPPPVFHGFNIPAPPNFPPPPIPDESEAERPGSALSTASATSLASVGSLDLVTWASSNKVSNNGARPAQQPALSDSEESTLDLDESIEMAAERSGILSDGEGEGDDTKRISSIAGESSSALDLLASSQSKPSSSSLSADGDYSSSDEEDFDLSLDASSVGTSRQDRRGHSLSRASVASFASSKTSGSSARSAPPDTDRFPSPKMPFSLKAGLLSPPASLTSSRKRSWLSSRASSLSLTGSSQDAPESWRFSSASAPDESTSTGRPSPPPPESLKRKASTPVGLPSVASSASRTSSNIATHKPSSTLSIPRQPRVSLAPAPSAARSIPTSPPSRHARTQSNVSTASSASSLDFGLDRAASPSSRFPMPPRSLPKPKPSASTPRKSVPSPSTPSLASQASRLRPRASVASLSALSSSPASPSAGIDEFGSLSSDTSGARVAQSTPRGNTRRSLRPPSSLGLSTAAPPASASPLMRSRGTSSLPVLDDGGNRNRRQSYLPTPPSATWQR